MVAENEVVNESDGKALIAREVSRVRNSAAIL